MNLPGGRWPHDCAAVAVRNYETHSRRHELIWELRRDCKIELLAEFEIFGPLPVALQVRNGDLDLHAPNAGVAAQRRHIETAPIAKRDLEDWTETHLNQEAAHALGHICGVHSVHERIGTMNEPESTET